MPCVCEHGCGGNDFMTGFKELNFASDIRYFSLLHIVDGHKTDCPLIKISYLILCNRYLHRQNHWVKYKQESHKQIMSLEANFRL